MKVLAERSDKIFIVGPILLLVSGVILYFFTRDPYLLWRRISRSLTYDIPSITAMVFFSALSVFVATIFNLVERIAMPKVLIEYDNAGLYIYKHRNKEPILIRFESIWRISSEVDYGSEDITLKEYTYEAAALSVKGLTGSLRLQTAEGVIKIRGIENVKDVERRLDKLHDEFMELRNERYEAIIAGKRRSEELAELAKHDPNT